MKRFFLFLILLSCSSHEAFAQLEIPFFISTIDYHTIKKEPGATVTVYDGTTVVLSKITPATGDIRLLLDSGKKYRIEISKFGKVTRSVVVNLQDIKEETMNEESANPGGGACDVYLFDEYPNIDFSFVKTTPGTEYSYNQEQGIVFNLEMAETMLAHVNALMREIEQLKAKKAADELDKKEDVKNQFNQVIAMAEKEIAQSNWTEAKNKLLQAQQIDPSQVSVKLKIKEIDGKISEELAAQKRDERYELYIQEGIEEQEAGKFDQARAKYNQAILLDRNKTEAPNKIVELDSLIANKSAIKDRQNKYLTLIAEGQNLENSKLYEQAIRKYNDALKIIDSQDARDRIEAIQGMQEEVAAEIARKKAEADSLAATKKAEEDSIKQAQELASKKAEADSLAAAKKAEEDSIKQAQEIARKKAEEDSIKQAQELARKKAEADSLAAAKKAEEDSIKQAQELARKKAEADSLAARSEERRVGKD